MIREIAVSQIILNIFHVLARKMAPFETLKSLRYFRIKNDYPLFLTFILSYKSSIFARFIRTVCMRRIH